MERSEELDCQLLHTEKKLQVKNGQVLYIALSANY